MSEDTSSQGSESERESTPAVLESPEEVLTTLKKDGHRRWMHPTVSPGGWLNLRRVVGYGLIAVFLGLPIVPIGGKPAVLLDLLHREFTFFGLTLYATDTLLLMVFMLTALVSIILITAVLGRAWCGWGCPQTVYMELVYRPIEQLLEGPAARRIKRDAADTSFEGFMRKLGKWAIFLVISLVLAHTFVAYFVGWESLLHWMTVAPEEHWGYFVLMAAVTGMIMVDFVWFREQMCTLACPYARIQSVLLDRDSLIVSYDPGRGEPRGRHTRNKGKAPVAEAKLALGDCVDCALCVKTCPTGIDIRDGLQMECINCTQCIDACDAVMTKVGKPKGLIRYSSLNVIEKQTPHVVRPRVIIYALLLVAGISVFTWLIAGRETIDAEIVRPNNGAPFMKLPDGMVANRVRFRVQNRSAETAVFHIDATEPTGTEIKYIGNGDLTLEAGQMRHVDAWIVARPEAFTNGKADASFRVSAEGVAVETGAETTLEFKLLGPWN